MGHPAHPEGIRKFLVREEVPEAGIGRRDVDGPIFLLFFVGIYDLQSI
jgi:hypothetical protein